MKIFVRAILTAALLSGVSAMAADSTPGVVADVSLTPAGDFKAKFDSVKGEATLKGDTVTADKLVIDGALLKTGLPLRDKHGKEKYMEIEKFPEIILTQASGKEGKGKAKLKFHGVEKDVTGTYKTDDKYLHAEFAIKLSDFGITGIKYMGVGVDDDVKVHATVPLKKAN